MDVHLTRRSKSESYGFGLGTEEGSGHLFITSVAANGNADGKLREDDRVVSVDGQVFGSLTHDQIVSNISNTVAVTLKIERTEDFDPTTTAGAVHAYIKRRSTEINVNLNRMVVTVKKKKDGGFGFGIGTLSNGDVLVTHISDNVADLLQPADIIFSIDGESMLTQSHSEIIAKFAKNDSVVLDIGRQEPDAVPSAVGTTTKMLPSSRNSISQTRPELGVESRSVNNIGKRDSQTN
eukprot:m.110109 g.110109  ORF g.110109 m.110109 type:complete len:236 (+) comp28012_c0_seq1:195-902(+)